jgi:hypothetical protein
VSRVYEFTVEPTTFQGLDPRSYVLVEPVPGGGRRIVAGTCDPAVLALDRVSDAPLSDADRASAAQAAEQAAAPEPEPVREPLHRITIADPSGMHQALAQSLERAGYLIHYERDEKAPILSGWVITGHRDGRQLNEQEIMGHR